MSGDDVVDLLVVGGGINGVGIARDAAGRGLKVVLCEQADIAQHTSSASSKLIHGGLRYLEYFEFRLVREALIEREVLLRAAPHIVRPMRFVLPHDRIQRPAWMIRIGLWLYDHLGGRELLPASATLDLATHPAGVPLKPGFARAFAYADCWVDDSRLAVLAALDARERGAEILTRTRCADALRTDGLWSIELASTRGAPVRRLRARALVNATGPWVGAFLRERVEPADNIASQPIRLVKGSHIVLPRLFDHDHPYILQQPDRRVVFAIPYEDAFTLIGTTDVDYQGDPAEAAITAAEIDYLCKAVNRYFSNAIRPADVVWSYAGVRPLYDDMQSSASAVTRDYVLDLHAPACEAPLLSIFGGKITTHRTLAEHALDRLQPILRMPKPAWTASAHLPGGDIEGADLKSFLLEVSRRWTWLPPALAQRYGRSYGTRIERLMQKAARLDDLGEHLGDGVFEAELVYLMQEEWAETEDDILWRRSKLGLHVSKETKSRLRAWLHRRAAPKGMAV